MARSLRQWFEATTELDSFRDVQETDYIPYTTHLDPHTLVTKNGEVLQCIKITGFTYESITREVSDLRSMIRKALQESIISTDYAVWVHTIRRAKSLTLKSEYKELFPRLMNDAWNQHNDWDHQYVNEVYITVLHQGETAHLKDIGHVLRAIIPPLEMRSHLKYMERATAELDATVKRMMETLGQFGAKRLGIYEGKDGTIYSEPMRFLNKLITLTEEEVPLQTRGIDEVLASEVDIAFGANTLEVRNYRTQDRHFGAMLTLKEYRELPMDALGRLLQMPCEFIISQCFDFINHKQAVKQYKEQAEIYALGEETRLPERIGLNAILQSDTNHPTDFGEHQITLMVLGDTQAEMEKYMRLCVKEMGRIGMIMLREDLVLEECYWAQLPANFPFLRRRKPINTARLGGFALLNNLPAGSTHNAHWGEACSLFYTAAGTPYFFNFHIGTNGHTMLVGPYGTGKTVLTNFLVAQARKYHPQLFYFDHHRASEPLIRAMDGQYIRFMELDEQERPRWPKMNPLQLSDSPANRSFLQVWLESLLVDTGRALEEHREKIWAIFAQAIERNFTLPKEQRTLRDLSEFVRSQDERVGVFLNRWHGDGEYGYVFDSVEDELVLSGDIHGFNMSALGRDKKLLIPVMAYVLHCVMDRLDGRPSMIVLDEAWHLLDNPIFATRLGGWLERLRALNCMAIFATEQVDEVSASQLSPTIMEHIATQIYLPNHNATEEYCDVFGLSARELMFVQAMDIRYRHFLLKRGDEAIVAELDMSRLQAYMHMLSANPETLSRMENAMRTLGPKAEQWLPEFIRELV